MQCIFSFQIFSHTHAPPGVRERDTHTDRETGMQEESVLSGSKAQVCVRGYGGGGGCVFMCVCVSLSLSLSVCGKHMLFFCET